MNYDVNKAWNDLKTDLLNRAEQTDYPNNPRFDVVTMAMHAEYLELLRKMAELDGTDGRDPK